MEYPVGDESQAGGALEPWMLGYVANRAGRVN